MRSNGVSRNLRLAAKLSKELAQDKTASVKSLLFQNKYRFYNVQAIYALVNEIIKHEDDLNLILENIDLSKIEQRLDPWLAKAYLTEILWGKRKLLGEGSLPETLLSYEEKCRTILGCQNGDPASKEPDRSEVAKPRYVRINTLITDAADAVKSFLDEGWQFVRCKSDSYDGYLKQLRELREDQFIPDFHVKVVFAFPPKTQFYNHQMLLDGEFFLQDKATSLAAFLLSPTPGSTVLDMCAAPGMKTTHLAAIMKNEGTIYAVEKNKERCETLKKFVESSGATCVKVMNNDVFTVDKNMCPNVDYILLDPSCSGSGMPRMEQNDFDYDFKSGRVKKLANFQAKLLRHALNEFRSAKRVVYSTCSLYPQENEEVLLDVIKHHKGDYELVSAKEILNNYWNNVGESKYFEIGDKCIYARPDDDLTSGVFLAVFEKKVKIDKTSTNEITTEKENTEFVQSECKKKKNSQFDNDMKDENIQKTDSTSKKKKRKHIEESNELHEPTENQKKKDKKLKRTNENNDNIVDDEYSLFQEPIENQKKRGKKKKHKKTTENDDNINDGESKQPDELVEKHSKKDKKKKHKETIENNDNIVNNESTQLQEPTESQKKKDKKKKRTNEVIDGIVDDKSIKREKSTTNDEEVIMKKKKKMKREHSQAVDDDNTIESTEVNVKKKKKKKSEKC